MRIKYNAPVVLTFSLICLAVLLLAVFFGTSFVQSGFAVPGRASFSARDPFDWLRIFIHPFGHAGWDHLLGNLSIILLVGPMLEEKHGGKALLLMMVITALVTGLLNVLLFNTGLMGASGVAFMMILLSSFVNRSSGDIPLSFLLVAAIFLGKELFQIGTTAYVSQFAHLIGGTMGAVFGFVRHK